MFGKKQEQVVVEIDKTGEVVVEVNNMKGNKCWKIVQTLMKAITGRKPDSATHKPEFHQTDQQSQAKQGR